MTKRKMAIQTFLCMESENINFIEIKGAIVKAVVFFDLFDYPLTLDEIWHSMSVKCELIEVIEALGNIAWKSPLPAFIKGGKVEYKNGFYFLAGRGAIVEERLKRYNFTDRKFKRALLVAKIFKFIPWIKMMAVGNLLGAHNLRDDSDIDFFIIAEDKRIWLTRFFCTGLAKLLRLRPQANNLRDKICLSFYVSEKAMDLSSLMLPQDSIASLQNDSESDDIYFLYWLAGLTPLYDAGGVYHELIKANQWLFTYLPNWRPVSQVARRQVKPLASSFYRDIIDLFIGGLEPQAMALQLKLLPAQLKNLMNQDNRVVVNNKAIKLHANDRRGEYGEKFRDKINNLSLLA